MLKQNLNKVLLLQNGTVIRSLATGSHYSIFHDSRGWWRYPIGGYHTEHTSCSRFYNSLAEFVEKSLYFEWEVVTA
jgi:hypothetical protein